MMKLFIIFFMILFTNGSCVGKIKKSEIICTDSSCQGTYVGPEFILFSDVAHQFSNKMCHQVGDRLKELYNQGMYVKVDFSEIHMSTDGMGTGFVTYTVTIPFLRVKEKCMAYTSFDHVGGWDHEPALAGRKAQLKKALIPGESLDISPLLKTKEGLQEYWIQWKNKDVQAECRK